MQTQIPQPVGGPEYHAAPEEDPAVSIATGEEPEEEEVEQEDPLEGLGKAQLEVPELVRLATDGFRHTQDACRVVRWITARSTAGSTRPTPNRSLSAWVC